MRKAELDLSATERAIRDNRQTMGQQQQRLQELQREQGQLQRARDEQQARIALELRTAWQMGRQGQLKVLLSQEDPHTVARVMGYYREFFEARNALLEAFRVTLQELVQVEQDIDDTLAELDQRQQDLARQQERLALAQRNREQAVAQLTASIKDKNQQLAKMEQDRKDLEKLLRAIEEAVVNLKVPEGYQDFAAVRGKLLWPVSGKPGNRFGKPRNEGKMRWQGVNIPAREGTEVKAIHHGRVVYADWLRGMGLLLIIDHGDGYMSLYAHNQTLLREVGEWVGPDTPVATVGSSGGLERSALYFEIRHDGKPVDPARWCRG